MDNYRKLENPIKDTIIDCIMSNPAYKNDLERAADVTVTLVAGHDTTGYQIAWILRELAKNPKEQQKLRESLVGLQPEGWDKSQVLRNIVKEGVRLYPVGSPGHTRQIQKEIITEEGYLLPKGTIAITCFIINQHDPQVLLILIVSFHHAGKVKQRR